MNVVIFIFFLTYILLGGIMIVKNLLELYEYFKLSTITEEVEDSYPTQYQEEETDNVVAIKQQQLYNVERYRERMKKLRESEDEDGLYEEYKAVTLEELGYFTGVENG